MGTVQQDRGKIALMLIKPQVFDAGCDVLDQHCFQHRNSWLLERQLLSTFFLAPYIASRSAFVYSILLFSLAPRWLYVITYLFLWLMALTIM